MGFGYLFLGYLVTFVLSISLERIGVGGAAFLLGYALMLRGLMELTRYQKSFSYAKWLSYPLLALSAFHLLESLNSMLVWQLPIFGAGVLEAIGTVTLLLEVCFQLAILFGIRMLAQDVQLPKIAASAIRNGIFLILYGILRSVETMPDAWVGSFVKYVSFARGLVEIVLIACNLFLLLACNKNICPEGDEDQPPRRSRFGLINRMNDAYDKTHQKNIENARGDAQEMVRRYREKKEQKKNRTKRK